MTWRGNAKVGDRVDAETFTVLDDSESKRKAAKKEGAEGGEQTGQRGKKSSLISSTRKDAEGTLTPGHVVHLAHRLAIFVCAVLVMANCIMSTSASADLLYGMTKPDEESVLATFGLMKYYIGENIMRESLLVTQGLGNDTTPRNATLYLANSSANGASFTQCASFISYQKRLYGDAFLRSIIAAIQSDPGAMLPYLKPANLELIAPIVDCMSPLILVPYRTAGRFFFLMRNTSEPDNVHMLTLMMSANGYDLPSQVEYGPTALGTFTITNDTRSTAPDAEHIFIVSLSYPFLQFKFRVCNLLGTDERGLWELEVLPWTSKGEIPKTIYTGSSTGFYLSAQDEQSNSNNHIWSQYPRPIDAVTKLHYTNTAVLYNTWAWVRFLQGFVALILLLNLIILLIIAYRNLQVGKIWIGDAFVASLGVLHIQGIWVFMYWYIEEFWSLAEFAIHDANLAAGIESVHMYKSVMHADLLAIYVTLCSWLGVIFKERVDPLIVLATFEIGFEKRAAILKTLFPSIYTTIQATAFTQYTSGYLNKNPYQDMISPMVSLSTRELSGVTIKFALQTLLPIIFMLLFVVAYILGHKIFVRLFPEKLHVLRSRLTAGTGTSENEEALLAKRGNFTMFEIATGAEMQNRFGFLADYETCVFIKGVKYATADGVYSNGFIIANHKYLVQTEDFWYIVLMKLLRWRFINIYAYELSDTTVQQRARLVYPQTLSWTDLANLNVKILS